MTIRDVLLKINEDRKEKAENISEEGLERILNESGFDKLPPGWTRESLMKFARSLTGKTKDDTDGFFDKCFEKMKDKEGFDEEGAKKFCAALKDEYLNRTTWRGKEKDDEEE